MKRILTLDESKYSKRIIWDVHIDKHRYHRHEHLSLKNGEWIRTNVSWYYADNIDGRVVFQLPDNKSEKIKLEREFQIMSIIENNLEYENNG